MISGVCTDDLDFTGALYDQFSPHVTPDIYIKLINFIYI